MVVVALTQIVMFFFLASGGEEPAQEPSDQWYLVVMLTSALQLVLLVATMWWATIRITHSVAGPAMLIERALDAMREGKFDSRLTLRDNDALKSLAEAAQRLADHLQQQQGTAPQARVTTGAAPHPVETR
jgi:nitrate/nitrite-specific signal transduction histidine kinase